MGPHGLELPRTGLRQLGGEPTDVEVKKGRGRPAASSNRSGVAALGVLDGVGSVEKDRTVRLPPPDSDVQ